MDHPPELIVITVGVFLVPSIHWWGLERVLLRKETRGAVIVCSCVLGLVGAAIAVARRYDRIGMAAAVALLSPTYQVWLFRRMHDGFVRRMNREPVNTSGDFRAGLGTDRAFSLLFILLSTFSAWLAVGVSVFLWNARHR
jgi:hypothetical protein